MWGDGKAPFPYAEGQEPPERLRESSSPEVLFREMDKAGVGGALIVQVSNTHITGYSSAWYTAPIESPHRAHSLIPGLYLLRSGLFVVAFTSGV